MTYAAIMGYGVVGSGGRGSEYEPRKNHFLGRRRN